jgi:hypothetical protein
MRYTESKIKIVHTYTYTNKKIKQDLDGAILEQLNDTYESEEGVIEKLEYKIEELQRLVIHIIEEMPKESRKNILYLFNLEEVDNES